MVFVLIATMFLGMVQLPGIELTPIVEAADNSRFKLRISPDGQGQIVISPEEAWDYTGLQDSMSISVFDTQGNGSLPSGLTYTWSSNFYNVLQVGKTQIKPPNDQTGNLVGPESSIYVYKIGPGKATISVSFDLTENNVTSTYTASGSIRVPLDINKTVNRIPADAPTKGHNFTTLVRDAIAPETALFFYENENDTLKEKVVTLLNTKSTPTAVIWETDNTNIAIVEQKSATDPVVVTAMAAGITKVKAKAYSDSSMVDEFYAIITPFFKDPLNNNNPVKVLGTSAVPIPMDPSTGFLDTNALNTEDLTWTVEIKKSDGSYGPAVDAAGKPLLELLPQMRSSKCYIKSMPKPRAGVYKITCQTKPKGVQMDPDLGIATAYISIGLKFMDETSVAMTISDVYSIFNNTTIQDSKDWNVRTADGSSWWAEPANTSGILQYKDTGELVAKNQGAVEIIIKLPASLASKYGIVNGTPAYQQLVTDGKKLLVSVQDAFGINSENLTLMLNQTANLIVSTKSSEPITWESSNPSIVAITDRNNEICSIQAKAVGNSVITVTQIVKGVTRTAKCNVKVLKSADSIKIDPNPVKMNIDEFQTLTAKITPTEAGGNLSWRSSDDKIVKIESNNGNSVVIKGVTSGKAVITVVNLENGIMDTCTVTVFGKATGLTVLPAEATVKLANKQLQLTATIAPVTEEMPEVVWNTSSAQVATVSKTGLVSFVSTGTVTITAIATNNPSLQGSSVIKIIKTVDGLKLEASQKVIYVGEVLKLGYTFTPADAENQRVKWKSSSPSVATVDDKGNITGVAVGETVIIAQAEDGNWVDTCTVSVKQKAKGVKIETKDVTLNKGDTYDIKYTIDPPTATDITLNWATNKASVATVSNTGRITAVGVGSCIITVTTSAGEVSYCNVTVIENASGIKLNFTEKTVYVNNSFTLRATIVPDGATNRKVTFSSSNSKIATVSTKGVVKGLKAGTAIITCSSEDGGYEARCIVTVKKLVTKVKLNYSSYILGLNKSLQLKATVTSNSATKKKVKWTSTSPGIAYVNSKGLVTGRKIGTATITAHSMDGSGIVARCKIKVVNPTSSIKLDKRNITMITGRTTTLKATVYPSNATYKTVKWSSSNPEVVAVEYDGRLTALKPGNATIEAKSKDSGGAKKAYCVVIVKDEMPATSVIITTKNPTMVQGQSITMRRSIVPPLSTDRVTWSSDNTMILSVDMTTGKVTARSAGTATITAITDSGKMDSTTVSVVGLSQSSITMEQYSQQTLFVEGATGVVRWTVANPNIAIVNNGVIESRKPGKTTVFATVNGIRLSCSVTVTEIGN